MGIGQIIKYDILNIFKSPLFYFLILLSIFPSIAISYSIKELKGPFDLQHITSFYALFGSISAYIFTIGVFTKDLTNETISFFMNNKSSRQSYILAKMISIFWVGLIFGLVGIITVHSCHVIYLGNEIPYNTYFEMLLNYILFSLFFGLLFLLVSLFYRNIISYYIVGLLFITFIPGIISSILFWEETPELVVTIVDHIPLYTLPAFLGGNALEVSHYISVICSIVILIILNTVLVKKRDY